MKVYAYDDLPSLQQSPFIDSYREILNESFDGKNVDVSWHFNNMPNSVIFMVENSSQICAICVVSALNDHWLNKLHLELSDIDTRMVTSVYTKLSCRRLGYSSRMIASLSKLYPRVILETYTHWVPAMTLYLSAGFKPTDSRRNSTGHIILFKKGELSVCYNKGNQ